MPDFTATITGLIDARSGSLICWCSATPRKVTLLATTFAKCYTTVTGDVVVVTALVTPRANTGISSDRCSGWETYDIKVAGVVAVWAATICCFFENSCEG